jgi:uncharacterized protein YjbI with pentapeptide repeats
MNDAADEPSKPTSAEPEFREISDEELERILADHKKWLAAEDKTGLGHLRANLSLADLRGRDLRKAALRGGELDLANLQKADLIGAQLQEASLIMAQLQGAKLGDAQLQGACLIEAQLQGARLHKAQFQGAFLNNANFERLVVTEDGEPGHDLPAADLTDADFRDADLTNAQLSTVTGLRAEKLAGAVLTKTKLPEDVARFDRLKHVEETSRNASTVFFGLLAASLYSWLTIATTTDVALITGSASSPLPIINTNIALSGFYLAAPLILIAVYCYFHLYLQRLWRGLASLPAVFPDGEALDDKAYPWLLNGLVRKHFKKLELDRRPLTRVENFVSIFLAWWVVPLTLLAFWLRFLPRHDWWLGTPLQVLLIAGAAWFGVYSYQLAVRTLSEGATARQQEKSEGEPLRVRIRRTVRRNLPSAMVAGLSAVIVAMLSFDAANESGDDIDRPRYHRDHDLLTTLGSSLGYETYADLTDDEVSTKPSGWTGRQETEEVEIGQVKGADLEGRDLRNADASGAFLVKAKFSGADLRGADLSGADLRGANLSRAVLIGADLRSAVLEDAILIGADLRADLGLAVLNGADLHGAVLTGAVLEDAVLIGAKLFDADLSGADLSGAVLNNAVLIGADLGGADLRGDLSSTDLRGADLSGADLDGAKLSGADLRGALNLTQGQVDAACGDDKTQLPEFPPGLTIRTCPVTAPPASSSPPPESS